MSDPVLNLRHFTKHVPTDMDWHGTYAGGYAEVRIWGDIRAERPEHGNHFVVAVNGNDDTSLVRFFDSWAEAEALFNSLRYLQSRRDLVGFLPEAPGRDNSNGWPTERQILTNEFIWPPVDVWDGVDFRHPENGIEGGTPVPW